MIEKKIYYHDTDAIGIVYHASYLKILEEDRTEFFEAQDILVKDFHEQGRHFVIKDLHIKYKSSARFGDIVICESVINKITAAQIFFSQKIFNKTSNIILIEADIILVIINEHFQPVIIPEDINSLLLENAGVIKGGA
ncbi:MAG: YbgC/FadM family acyl-CoA thioesterase [Candidatus Omnitrophica bacterium]|nr:YbgC/FadM family acyl-CoA thioesterase [Candidatus Omnitrophota bacterium]MBU1997307.1 YbgC/FadM family acyl-CoA thioesterase [Candidatus Omnitrophota bacterium]MBU4332912.1 YbgC/FadM family acyl-CoA thioesterase [Candidatus Omnitrophota bacterium]